jgi:hypothetical protein
MAYDIIGDIHGHADELQALLTHLGYQQDGTCYRHPDRQAIFVGDFIDMGPQQQAVLNIVMPMVTSGAAQAVMGNHEFNALAYHTRSPHTGEWLRPRDYASNTAQHQAFLDAYPDEHDAERDKVLAWFMTLPMWLELDGLRIVHACWHDESVSYLKDLVGPGNTLDLALLTDASEYGSLAFKHVEILLKGWELPLPAKHSFTDNYGHKRTQLRSRWWLSGTPSYRAAGIHDIDSEVLEELLVQPGQLPGYHPDEVPVFTGHYWLKGTPGVLAANVACVDYAVAKQGQLVAYCWDGEEILNDVHFFLIDNLVGNQ